MAAILLATKDYNQRLQHQLNYNGHQTIPLESGAEVLETLKTSTPALLVLDADLPDINGWSICKRMRKISRLKDVPVVIVVDKYQERERLEAQMVYVSEIIVRPLSDSDIHFKLLGYVRKQQNSFRQGAA